MNPEQTAWGILKCRSLSRFRQAANPAFRTHQAPLFATRPSGTLISPFARPDMAQFPKPDSSRRATRLRMMQALTVRIARAGAEPLIGVMQTLSRTGGRARLNAGFKQGDLVEVELHTPRGELRALVEMLAPQADAEGVLQPFRFVGLEDEQHKLLLEVLALLREGSPAGSRKGEF